MKYVRITSIDDPLFAKMYELLKTVFPEEEVLEFELWKEPLQDPNLRVCVAVLDDNVVGATEYRYYPDMNVAMTDFTIIGKEGLGIGRFLMEHREKDLLEMAAKHGNELLGMFAEIYDPYRVQDHSFGSIKPMDPYVRREVLSHIGYRKLNFPYVHPSWKNDGEAVSALDFCFLSYSHKGDTLPADLIVRFLQTYYAILPNKSDAWHDMIENLKTKTEVELLPI
ncbi:GNAT family N-acetyltransferase [Parageobacillus toebii]|jgi:hypothetical protein|uniref:GNAT family N-acetyltransferase n=1 Tax=Parageobacillus toebii TaxID=153151 RepID=UPI0035B54C10